MPLRRRRANTYTIWAAALPISHTTAAMRKVLYAYPYIHTHTHSYILTPVYMTSRLYTIFSTPDFSDPFSLSALYISFILVLFSPLLMSLFPSVLALPSASFSSPFHSLPFTLSSCVLFSSPFSCLIYFLPHSSLGSFRGSVGRAIGC